MQEREQRGLSLPDVAHLTRIPAARLRDLEEDNYTSLGSVAYAKGHLRAYADMLGVDAGTLLDEMKAPPLGGRANYRYLVETYGPLRAQGEMTPQLERPTVQSRRSATMLAIVSAFSVLVVGGVLLGNAFMNQNEPEPEVLQSTETSTGEVQPASAPAVDDGEFTLLDASVEVAPEEEVRPVAGTFVPPKATPVNENEGARPSRRNSTKRVPKAVPVQ